MCDDSLPGVGDLTAGASDLIGGLALKLAPVFWTMLGAGLLLAHLVALAICAGVLAVVCGVVVGAAVLIAKRLERSRATLVQSTPSFTLRLAARYHPELAAQQTALPAAQRSRRALEAGPARPMPRGLAITGARTLDGRTIRRTGGTDVWR